MSILEQLAEYAVYRVEQAKKTVSLEQVKEQALLIKKEEFVFEKTL